MGPKLFGAGEKLQRRGVDGLWPLEEPEMTGVGYLHVASVGQGFSDLASQAEVLSRLASSTSTTSSANPITNTGAAMLRYAGNRLFCGETPNWQRSPGVCLIGHMLNTAIQSATATSSLSVLREKLSSKRALASYDTGT